MQRYVFYPVVDFYSSKKNQNKTRQQTGLVTGLQVLQVQSYPPPPTPPRPPPICSPTPPSTPAGKTAEGSRGTMPDVPSHDSKRALDQRASGGKVWERPGKKKTYPWLLSSGVLILFFKVSPLNRKPVNISQLQFNHRSAVSQTSIGSLVFFHPFINWMTFWWLTGRWISVSFCCFISRRKTNCTFEDV